MWARDVAVSHLSLSRSANRVEATDLTRSKPSTRGSLLPGCLPPTLPRLGVPHVPYGSSLASVVEVAAQGPAIRGTKHILGERGGLGVEVGRYCIGHEHQDGHIAPHMNKM